VLNYDRYNREERSLCAHFFRLLHEKLSTDPSASPLRAVLRLLGANGPRFEGGPVSLADSPLDGAAVLCEVAFIRDAYRARKPDPSGFMETLVALVAKQEQAATFSTYGELPPDLRNPRKTHPNQIAKKARDLSLPLGPDGARVYGAVQGMFNAKPDLALVLPNCLIVFEAKFTEQFDEVQLQRTRNIAEVWATLLYADLGFVAPPPFAVAKLGDEHPGVHLSWQDCLRIAAKTYPPIDRTRIAFECAVKLLKSRRSGIADLA
jgi:hypothetical protein